MHCSGRPSMFMAPILYVASVWAARDVRGVNTGMARGGTLLLPPLWPGTRRLGTQRTGSRRRKSEIVLLCLFLTADGDNGEGDGE